MKKLLFTVIIAASIVGCSPSTQIVKKLAGAKRVTKQERL